MKKLSYKRTRKCIEVHYDGAMVATYASNPDGLIELTAADNQWKHTFNSVTDLGTWLKAEYPTIIDKTRLLQFCYNDGGRSKYFKAAKVGDCVTRAISIATGKDYKEVYDALNDLAKNERTGKRKHGKSSSRNGVYKETYRKYLESIGWTFVPTMEFGSGCKVHLASGEIPMDKTIIARVSSHLTCVINGVLNDTYDCSRGATRCVYGYFIKND